MLLFLSKKTMVRYIVTLTQEEREILLSIIKKGSHKSSKMRNALVLLNCDTGEYSEDKQTNEQISNVLKIGMRTIDRIKKAFVEDGFEIALNGRPSTRLYKKKIDGDVEAHIVALSCSNPPDGFARWSLRLLADKAVELEYIDSISHESVRQMLKKTN